MKLFVYSDMICISWTYWQVVLGIKIGAPIFNSAQSTALSSRDVNPKMCSFVMPFLLLSIETILFSLHIALLTAYGLWLQPGVLNPLFLLASNAEVANMLQPLVMVDRPGKQTNPWCQQDMRKTSRHLLTASRCATLLSTLGRVRKEQFSVAA